MTMTIAPEISGDIFLFLSENFPLKFAFELSFNILNTRLQYIKHERR